MSIVKETELLKTAIFTVKEREFAEKSDFKPVCLDAPDWICIIPYSSPVLGYNNLENFIYLFVEQTRWGVGEKTIEFPCGTVEPDEDPKTTALRELKEESGLDLKDSHNCYLKQIGSFNPNPAFMHNKMTVFAFKVPDLVTEFTRNVKEQKLDKDEDCKCFLGRLQDFKEDLHKNGMMISALKLFEDYVDKEIVF